VEILTPGGSKSDDDWADERVGGEVIADFQWKIDMAVPLRQK
jgi:hypothetical protein